MAVAPVVIEFLAKGVPDIARAFRSVEDTVTRSQSRQTKAVSDGAKAQQREAEKTAKKAQREQEKEEKRAERAAAANARRIASNKEFQARLTGRIAKQMADAEIREANRATKAQDRETKKRVRAAKEAAREIERIAEGKTRIVTATGRGVAQSAGTVARGAGRVAGMVTQLGGGFSIQDSVQEAANLERAAVLLSNKDPKGRHIAPSAIVAEARRISARTGTDADKVLGAWSAYSEKTGEWDEGKKNSEFFAKLSKATGADLGQIATTAGLLRVQNKDLTEDKMQQLLIDVVQQGRTGAVDMPELAGHASAITKSSSAFAGDQADTQRRLLGLSQVGVRTGSVAEAATAISNLSLDASKHSSEIKGLLGAKAFNEKGQIAQSPEEFLADIIAKTGGNRQKIYGLGFGNRSMRMFDALLPTYNDAEKKALAMGMSKTDATAYARKATLKDMTQFTEAKYSREGVEKDFAAVMNTAGEKFEAAVRDLKTAIGDKLLPELVKLIPVLRELTPQLARLLGSVIRLTEWALDNPFKVLVGLITKSLIESIVSAKIGDVIKNLLISNAGGGGGVAGALTTQAGTAAAGAAGGGGAGGGTAAAAGAGLGMGAGLAVAVGGVGIALAAADQADRMFYQPSREGAKRGQQMVDEAARTGKVSDADRAEIEQAKKDSSALNWAMAAGKWTEKGLAKLNPFSTAVDYGLSYGVGKYRKSQGGPDMSFEEEKAGRVAKASEIASREQEIADAAKRVAESLNNAADAIDAADPGAENRNKPMNKRSTE